MGVVRYKGKAYGGGPEINDSKTSRNSVWSSEKISNELKSVKTESVKFLAISDMDSFAEEYMYVDEGIPYLRIPNDDSLDYSHWINKEQSSSITVTNKDTIAAILEGAILIMPIEKIEDSYIFVNTTNYQPIPIMNYEEVLSIVKEYDEKYVEDIWYWLNGLKSPMEELPKNMWEVGNVYANTEKTEILFKSEGVSGRIALKGNHGLYLYAGDEIRTMDTDHVHFAVLYKKPGESTYSTKALNNKLFRAESDGMVYITVAKNGTFDLNEDLDLAKYIRIISKSFSRVGISAASNITESYKSEFVTPTDLDNTTICKDEDGKYSVNANIAEVGKYKVKRRSKNLLYLPNQTVTSNGITVTVNDQLVTVSGSMTTVKTFLIKLECNCPPLDGNYTISMQNLASNITGGTLTIKTQSGTTLVKASSYRNSYGNADVVSDDFYLGIQLGNTYSQSEAWTFNAMLNEGAEHFYEKAEIIDEYSFIGDIETLKKSIGTDEYPLSKIIKDGGNVNVFNSITCIGDSLTAGCFEHNDSGSVVWTTIQEYSYPTFLKKVSGIETVRNYGKSGCMASAKTGTGGTPYLAYADSQNWLTTSDKTDAYIIALGTNDITYTGFDSTSESGYLAIINRIKTIQPRAKIFCVGIPNTRNSTQTITSANAKIKSIAESNGCYFLDMQTYYVQPSEVATYKAKYYNGGHRNALGYSELANAYCSYIDWIINNNPTEFNDIQFVDTDYSYT